MNHDLFALWSSNEMRFDDIADGYAKSKYLFTRDPRDANKIYKVLLKTMKFPDMRLYTPSPSVLEGLPRGSFFLQFTFKLITPYISKDDEGLYIHDNPVKKEKVFKAPMISGSTWKGNLRWTAGRVWAGETPSAGRVAMRVRITKLFGHENDAEKRWFDSQMSEKEKDDFNAEVKYWTTKDGLRRGRLNFFPTFFASIGLDVINPHDRRTKAGTMPIYIESVPAGSSGVFSLLYVPFDLIGREESERKGNMIEDLGLLHRATEEMVLTYGFSAKRGNGFGVVDEKVEGIFEVSGYPIYKEQSGATRVKVDDSNPFAKLKDFKVDGSKEKIKDNVFEDFGQLKGLIEKIRQEVMKDGE